MYYIRLLRFLFALARACVCICFYHRHRFCCCLRSLRLLLFRNITYTIVGFELSMLRSIQSFFFVVFVVVVIAVIVVDACVLLHVDSLRTLKCIRSWLGFVRWFFFYSYFFASTVYGYLLLNESIFFVFSNSYILFKIWRKKNQLNLRMYAKNVYIYSLCVCVCAYVSFISFSMSFNMNDINGVHEHLSSNVRDYWCRHYTCSISLLSLGSLLVHKFWAQATFVVVISISSFIHAVKLKALEFRTPSAVL